MNNWKALKGAFIATLFLFSTASIGETLKVPVGESTQAWHGEKPRRGLTKAQVESQFGSPTSVDGPKGEPPIYFWEYPDFTVYFESDYVIHTVIKNRSAAN